MSKSTKLSGRTLFNIILFAFMGQVAWAVENNFFNMYLFNRVGGDSTDVANMVAASAIVAVLTTLFMGSLSDKVNKRKMFITVGYILWGFTVMSFAIITPEFFGSLFNKDAALMVPFTVNVVIIMDCLMTFMGSTSNDAAFNAWVTDVTDPSNRKKTETLLAAMPVAALIIVTVAFGTFSAKFGYGPCFVALGAIVTACGVIGIFSIEESRDGVKTTASFFECLIYGFKPSVIKGNLPLYLSLLCMGVFSVAGQIFFPYIFIYVQHYIDFGTIKTTSVPMIVFAVVLVIAAVITFLKLFTNTEKFSRGLILVPCVFLFVVGLGLVFFADKNIILFGATFITAMAGFVLLMILLGATIRDFTPEDKAGQLQGIRMIFSVMLPMIIGPRVAASVTDHFAVKQYLNEYGVNVNVPAPHIFLAAAAVGTLIFIPLAFLIKHWKKVEAK